MSIVRVGRWMIRAEYDAMKAEGRIQPTLDGRDMKHVTIPPDSMAFRNAESGSVFVEFDVDDTQIVSGGRQSWYIIYGPNSFHGRRALQNGRLIVEMPVVENVVITEIKHP